MYLAAISINGVTDKQSVRHLDNGLVWSTLINEVATRDRRQFST